MHLRNRQSPPVRRSTSGVTLLQRASAHHDDGHELPPPSIAAQLQAARRGHSLSAVSLGSGEPLAQLMPASDADQDMDFDYTEDLDLSSGQELTYEVDAADSLIDAVQELDAEEAADLELDDSQESEDAGDLELGADQESAHEADTTDNLAAFDQDVDPEQIEDDEAVQQHRHGLQAPSVQGSHVIQRMSFGIVGTAVRAAARAVGSSRSVRAARGARAATGAGRRARAATSVRAGRGARAAGVTKKSRPNGISTILRNNLWNKKNRAGIVKKDWYTGYEAQHIIPYAIARDLGLPLHKINDVWNGMMLPSGRRTAKSILYKAVAGQKGMLRPRHIKKGLAHPKYNKQVKDYIERERKALNNAPVKQSDMEKWADHIRRETKKLGPHQAVDDIVL